ncbi:3-coathanger stack domain-containing protein [Thiocystis violacea]|uniref:3-coathanger stack domain-containing protein n=1 Tax=Thiocystis violacea TaxID=13725 RepID=UPI001904CA41|nr:3-coathanger stack domain-containing protein [Thiocystis violacea]
MALDVEFTPATPMYLPRMAHAQLTLNDGTVVVFGGHGTGFTALNTAEILYDGAPSFQVLNMLYSHDWPAFAVSDSGEVLLAGGSKDWGVPGYVTAETFDPTTELFSATDTLNRLRTGCGAAYLTGGKALIAGGWWIQSDAHTYGEIYDPSTRTFTPTGPLNVPRAYTIVLPADDGQGVVMGGYPYQGGAPIDAVEVYDVNTNSFAVLQDSLFPPEMGWGITASSKPIAVQDQRMDDGRYLFLAFKSSGSVSAHRLLTYDPATKVIAQFETNPPLPDSTEFSFHPPVVDRIRGKVRILALNTEYNGSGHEYYLFSVNLSDGDLEQSESGHVLNYSLGNSGMSLLPNGNLFVTGGSMTNNFDPVSNTLIIAPNDVSPQEICHAGSKVIEGEDYHGDWYIRAETTLSTHGPVIVFDDADVVFQASRSIALGHGFRVAAGGRFHGSIGPVTCSAVL